MAQQTNIVGKVALLEGQAFARSSDGSERQLKLGDAVYEGEVIITREGSKVELAFDQGPTFLLREKETLTLDSSVFDSESADAKNAALLPRVGELTEITQAIATGSSLDQLLEETAAGLTGGGASNDGHNFVQLIRIVEAIPPLSYEFISATPNQIPPLQEGQILQEVQKAPESAPTTSTPPTITHVGDGSINNVTVAEGTAALFTVNLSNASSTATAFALTLANGSATAPGDYTHALSDASFSNGVTISGGTITVPAGVTSFTVTVPSVNDTLYETSEDFTLSVGGVSGTGTITDNDAAPVFSVADASISEGGLMSFTVTRTGDAQAAQSVNFATSIAGGNSASSGDFSASSGSLSFAQGETSKTFTVQTTHDTLFEGNETFTVTLSGATAGATVSATQGAATGTIVDNDGTPTITHVGDGSINNVTVAEGTAALFTVNLSNASSTATAFALTLANGSATAPGDYTNALSDASFSNGVTISGGTITVPAGVTSFTVTVPSVNDTLYETSEDFTLSVGGVSGTGTITDNDAAPVFSVADASISEGGLMSFTVTRTGDAQAAQSVNFATSIAGGNSASSGDFSASSGSLSFAQGETSKTFTVQTTHDTLFEGNETFTVTLSGATAGATVSATQGAATGTIVDNDGTPTITHVGDGSINNVTVAEGTAALFTVNLSNASSTATAFALTLANGSATAPGDYTHALSDASFSNGVTISGGTITVPAGVTSFTVTVPSVNDTLYETSEDFTLSVGGVSGTGTITDNDAAPVFSVADASISEGGLMSFTVTRTGDAQAAQSVNFATSIAGGNSASSGDFSASSGSLSFAQGETSKTFTVQTTHDTLFEGNETFTVTLSGATAGATVSATQGAATGTIVDNDGTPTITHVGDGSINNVTVAEGTAALFTVNLSNASSTATAFALTLANGSATAPGDYTHALSDASFSNGVTISGGTITVPAGVTSFTVTVPSVNDTLYETSEDFTLSVGGVSGTGTITDNDAAPVFSVADASISEGGLMSFTVTRTGDAQAAQSVNFATSIAGGNSASSGDFSASSGSLSFAQGETSKTFTVQTTHDTLFEGNETFTVTLSGATAGATVSATQGAATGTIVDNDGTPTITHVGDGSINNVTVAEGTAALFTVNLSNASSTATAFALTLANGSATAPGDYTHALSDASFSNGVTISGGTITVPAGVTSFTVTVPSVNDTLYETSEDFTLSVGGVSGTGTITDNDAAPVFSVADASISEGGLMSFTVTRTGDAQAAQSVNFATSIAGGNSASSGDFSASSGSLSFAQGETSKTFTVQTTHDTLFEGNETFTVTLSGATAGATVSATQGAATGTIVDNDGTPTITHVGDGSINNVTVAEGTAALFTVNLSNASSTATAFALTLANGSATAPGDYTHALSDASFSNGVTISGGTITVPAGVTSFTVTVPSVNDTLYETSEDFTLSVGGVSGTGTITDNDAAPVFSVADASISEGGLMSFTVTRTGDAQAAQSVNFATSIAGGNSASSGDFSASSGSLSFAQGETSKTFTVQTTHDTLFEGNETFTVTLSGATAGATVSATQGAATGTIVDNDGTPTITHVGDGSINNVTVAEGTAALFTVNLSNASSTATAFALTLANGSATAPGDYTHALSDASFSNGVTISGGTITVPAGVTSFTVTVPSVNDTLYETSEDFTLSVGGVSGTGTITDNDAAPVFSVADASISEGGLMSFTVTRTGDAQAAQSVNFATSIAGGNSASSGDFSASSGSLSFAQGETSKTFTVQTTHDTLFEGNETFTVTLSGATAGATVSATQGAATGTIVDNDGTPTITHVGDGSINNVTVAEGTAALFTVNLSNASSTATAFALTLANGSATAPGDYTNALSDASFSNGVTISGGTITVPAGVTSFTVTVPSVNDTLYETSEDFTLSVGGVSGTGTITDNDAAPVFSVADASISEGGLMSFTVTRTGDAQAAQSVNFATSIAGGNSASSGDFSASSGSLSFAQGETSKTFTVQTTHDTLFEGNETFTVTLSGATAGATVSATQGAATGTIVDNDGTPTITHVGDGSINNVTVAEGTAALFTVNLSNASSTATAFALTLANGSATAPGDYTHALSDASFSNGVTISGGTITVPAGVTSFTVTVPSVNDTLYETSEDFTLSVGGVSGTGTITDNDAAPVFSVADASISEGGLMSFTVTRTGDAQAAQSVNFATSIAGGNSASSGDFSASSGSLSFAQGETSKTFTVQTTHDTLFEGNETFTVTLSGATAGATVSATQGAATGTIVDNDGTPTITHVGDGSINNVTVAEGTAALFTVNLSNASSTATAFALTLANGSATAPGDYTHALSDASFSNGVTISGGTITVPAGVTSFTVTVPSVNDTLYETSEDFTLSVGGVSGTGTITDNDAAPVFSVADASISEGGLMSFTVTRTGDAQAAQSVNFATSIAGGNSASTGDFSASSGSLSFAQGETSKTFTVQTTHDTLFEGNETFTVTLSGATAGATVSATQGAATGTIVDNDGTPTITHVGDGSINNVTVAEGTAALFTVNLSNASSTATAFALTLANGSATAPGDYTHALSDASFSNGVTISGGTITVPAGVTSFTVTVPSVNDTLYETSEDFTLSVGGVSGTGTITDNDAAPVFSVADASISEGGLMSFTVTRTGDAQAAQSVNFATSIAGGNSASTGDFSASSGSLSFAQGETSKTFTVQTTHDTLFEGNETFTVTLSGATAGATVSATQGAATGTIVDNDGTPAITHVGDGSINNVTVAEGTAALFTVNLSNASSTATAFALTLANGSATAPGDYTHALSDASFSNGVTISGGTITVPAGVTSFTVTVPSVNDTLYETSEDFTLSVGGVSGTGTITDNDAAPVFSVADASISEGGLMSFTVTRTGDAQAAQSVNFATSIAGGNSASTGDFSASSGSLSFAQGETSKTFTVQTTQDTLFEGNETFTVTLSGATAGATVSATQGAATGTIVDNDPVPTVSSITSPTVVEGANLVYTVTLSNGSSTATTFPYTLGGGTAATTDYGTPSFTGSVSLAGGILTVPAGVTSFTVTLPTVNDLLNEATETVPLNIGGVTGTGSITDNDATPSLSINNVTVNEAAGTATFTVTLSAASGQTVSVGYNTSNVTATAGSDYTSATGTLTFAPGVTTQTITVPILNDLVFEPTETFNVNLVTPTNATISTATGVGTITDNDPVPTVSSVSNVTVAEGVAAVFTVNLSNASATATSLALNLASGTATLGLDFTNGMTFNNGVTYNSGTGLVSVPAGVTSFTVTVPTLNDAINEATESFTLSVGGVNGTGSITNFNSPPVFTTTTVSATVSEEGLAGGLKDTTGSPSDTTDVTVITGTMGISDPDGSTPTVTLAWPGTPPALTAGGVAVTWTGAGTNTLIGSAGGAEVVRIAINNTGNYTVNLSKAIDHTAANVEDVLSFNVQVSATDGVATTTGTLAVNIEDDSPLVGNLTQAVVVPKQDTNLMIILDVSLSMNDPSGIPGKTRLDAAKDAINQLIDSYSNLGDVKVRVISFSTGADWIGNVWVDPVTGKSQINSLSAVLWTNYDAALGDAMTAFGHTGKIAGASNVSYFLSDGAPTYSNNNVNTLTDTNGTSNNNADEGIQAAEELLWTNFLNTNDIRSYSIGIGTGLPTNAQTLLDPIAYNGVGAGTNTNATIVTDMSQLTAQLQATLPPATSGNLLTGNVAFGSGSGADGGYMPAITLDGVTYTYNIGPGTITLSGSGGSGYTYDVTTHELTITTALGGSFKIDMDDGQYSYTPSVTLSGTVTQQIGFSLTDRDGDQSTGILNLQISSQGSVITGTSSGDTLFGTTGADTLIGGAGNDTLSGLAGADTFKWNLADRGTVASPARDTTTDFDNVINSDKLDLRDLLQGELHTGTDAGNLADYLHFSYNSATSTTVVEVKSQGTAMSAPDQIINLAGIDLVGSYTSDQQIIQDLLSKGKLISD